MSQSNSNGTYVESTIIMTTVRVVVPFVFTFGLFVMFHGAESAGGGFQGGVIVASAVLLLAFAFGIESTRAWLEGPLVRGAIAVGGATFALIGLGAAWNGAFLDYAAYGFGTKGVKYGIELVELAIGAIVSGVLIGLFYSLAVGDVEIAAEHEMGIGEDVSDIIGGEDTDVVAGDDTDVGAEADVATDAGADTDAMGGEGA